MPITQFVEKVHLWEFVEKQLRAATIKQCRAPEVTRMLSFLAEPQGTIVRADGSSFAKIQTAAQEG
jgi:hypothetical protein